MPAAVQDPAPATMMRCYGGADDRAEAKHAYSGKRVRILRSFCTSNPMDALRSAVRNLAIACLTLYNDRGHSQ
jgi:hypothetical protein